MNAISSPLRSLESIKVLVVEDNEEHAILFEHYLRRTKTCSFSVSKARNHATGFETLTKKYSDVMLFDLTRQENQGIDTLFKC